MRDTIFTATVSAMIAIRVRTSRFDMPGEARFVIEPSRYVTVKLQDIDKHKYFFRNQLISRQ